MKEKKVLVVDDDLYMRIYISTLLKTSGFESIVAKDGKEGISKAKESSPNLIILDLMMPGKGGVLMYQQLKADKMLNDIPVIILSGVERKSFFHSLNMLSVGLSSPLPKPDAYIEKPPRPEELLKTIESLF